MILVFCICAMAMLVICQWLIYFYAPLEVNLGLAQKIFYLHLPLAWWALFSFFLVFIFSIAWLLKRRPAADEWARAFAELGALYGSLALLTGMLWAKISWGVWWTWDPRLSTTLIMWFVYMAYLLLGKLDMTCARKSMIRSVVGIVAFLDVPLVFFSARIFRSIHPAVFASRNGGLEPEMRLTVICCVAAMGFLAIALALLRKNQLTMQRETAQIMEKKILEAD